LQKAALTERDEEIRKRQDDQETVNDDGPKTLRIEAYYQAHWPGEGE
jgi:hypothetical protein